MSEKKGRQAIPIEELNYVHAPQHLCLIYDDLQQWQAFVSSFLRIGLEQNEKCLYVYDTHSAKQLRDMLRSTGIDVAGAESSGQLVLVHGSRFHINEGFFDPDKTIRLLVQETQNALKKGFKSLRVTSETEWVLQQFPGAERFMEYEARANKEICSSYPCLYVCQFEREKYTTEMIKGIMQTHPVLIRAGQVFSNSYYLDPDKFLTKKHAEIQTLDWFNYAEREVRLEKEIKENARRLQLLYENAMVVILVADGTGHYIDGNKSALEFLECTREELLKMTIWDTMPPQYPDRPPSTLPRPVLPRMFEAKYVVKGKTRTILLNLVPVTTGGKEVVYGIGQDITRRKEMEKSLRESEERWQFALEGAGDGVWDWDIPSNRVYFSRQWKAMLGYNDSEIGDSLSEWESRVCPDDLERVNIALKKHFEGETPVYSSEHRMKCKDGSYKWMLDRGKIIKYSPEGKPLRAIGIHSDITPGKNIEEALAQSEQNFRAMAENNHDSILVFSGPDARVMYFNKQATELLGFTADELSQLKLADLVTTPDYSRLSKNYASRLRGENVPNRYEAEIIDHHGKIKTVEISGAKTTWQNATADLVIVRDVTERKRIEQALKNSEEKLRAIFETITDGLIITDLAGTIIDINQKVLDLFADKDKSDSIGKSVFESLSPNSEAKARESFMKCLEIGLLENVEIELKRMDGSEFMAELSGCVLKDNLGVPAGVIIVARDITERKQAQNAMQALYQKEKAQRLELEEEAKSRGMFIDVLAHELRTPLTPILVSAEMLGEIVANQPENVQSTLIQNLNRGVQVLSGRLEDLLDIGRYARGTFKLNRRAENLRPYLIDVLGRCRPLLDSRGQVLETELADNLAEAEIDPLRLEQVISNLLSNASKFSQDRAKIIFKARIRDGGLLVEVIDYGEGVTREEQARLFQPYHRIEQDRQKFPGIGLGLAVSKQIVEVHGGRIWLVSEPGRGSTFSFFIPLNNQKPE